MAEFPTLKGL